MILKLRNFVKLKTVETLDCNDLLSTTKFKLCKIRCQNLNNVASLCALFTYVVRHVIGKSVFIIFS